MNVDDARALVAVVIDGTADEFQVAAVSIDDFPGVALKSIWAVIMSMVELELGLDAGTILEINDLAGWEDVTMTEIEDELSACLALARS